MKKIAVIVRGRQAEALRMALGLSVLNGVDIYLLDNKLEESDNIMLNLEMIGDMRMGIYTNNRANENIKYMTTEDIAKRLLKYDNILSY